MQTIICSPQDDLNLILKPYKDKELKLILTPGNYVAQLEFDFDNLIIEGVDPNLVTITYSLYAKMPHEDGRDYGTFRTPTLTILGNNVILRNLTIRNDAGIGKDVGQAVALALYGDNILVDNCNIIANQDTLFLGPLPNEPRAKNTSYLHPKKLILEPRHHHIINSKIVGNVDFIFGSSTALFENCEIVINDFGYITAPSTHEEFEYGFIFKNSKIVNTSNHEIYLSRPWRNYGANIFYNCQFSGLINSNRYDDWGKTILRYYEHPYYNSTLSSPMSDSDIDKLEQYRLNNFNNRNNS